MVPRERRIGRGPRAEAAGRCRCRRRVIRLYADYLHAEYGDLDSDYVFVNLWSGPSGSPLTYPSVYDLICRMRQRTGIDIRAAHRFDTRTRPSCCAAACAVEVVGKLLGHASIATTSDTYAHLKVEDARRALGGGGLADRPGRAAVSVEALATPLNTGAASAPGCGGASGVPSSMCWCPRWAIRSSARPRARCPGACTPAATPGCVWPIWAMEQAGRPDRRAWAGDRGSGGDGPSSRCNRAWCTNAGLVSIGIGCATSIPKDGTEPDDHL